MNTLIARAPAARSVASEVIQHERPNPFLRRIVTALAGLILAVGSLGVVGAAPAAAASGVATSYGFDCSANHWVRNNFPNMTSISGGIERVYFRSDLYRWNGAKWVYYASRGWYSGAANGQGKLALGNLGGIPYYWILNNGTVFDQGAVFNSLPSGYYTTAEFYQWQNGASASRWSFVNGTSATFCYIA